MLVGRAPEAAQIAELLEEDHPVLVVGEAGIGKTALLHEVSRGSGRPAFEGGALSTLTWMRYLPLQRALGRTMHGADPIAVTAEVEAAVQDGVLLIDDLHWADDDTIAVTEMLAKRIGLLTAMRPGHRGADELRARLQAAGFHEVLLGTLAGPDAHELTRQLRPDLSSADIDTLVLRTGGNPLLLQELAATGEPSQSLRLALEARLRRLDAPARAAFGLLAVADRPMPRELLRPADAELLERVGLVTRDDDAVGVRHALLAEVAVESASAEDVKSWHAQLAQAVSDPGERARHLAGAGQRERAYEAAMNAAEAARLPGERADHLHLASSCASGPNVDALRLEAAKALTEAHDWSQLVATLDRIESGDPELRAWAALLRARGAWAAGETEVLRTSLSAGLALVHGTRSEAEVLLRIEQCRLPIFIDCDLVAGVELATAGFELAQTTGFGLARAQYFLGTALGVADRPGWHAHLRGAIEQARQVADLDTEFVASINLVSLHESGGSPAQARDIAAEAIERARSLALGEWEAILLATTVNLDYHLGHYDAVVSRAQALLARPIEQRSRDMLIEILGLALVDLGRLDQAVRTVSAHAESAVPDYRGRDSLIIVHAEAALWGGQPERARALADDYIVALQDDRLNRPFGHLVRAWACLDLGVDPGASTDDPLERAMLAAVPFELAGVRALYLGDAEHAVTSFDAAAQLWAPYHRRGELRCAWAAGEAARRAGDSVAAVSRLTAVEARVQQLSMWPLLGRVHRSLRAAGEYRAAARSRTASGLSGREQEVLDLIGAGLTNGQVAARLGITRRTVAAHVASARPKLRAANRAHAAALAASTAGGGASS